MSCVLVDLSTAKKIQSSHQAKTKSQLQYGRVVKLVDTLVLGTSAARLGGSNPLSPTMQVLLTK